MKEKQTTPGEEVFVTNLKEIVTAARRYAYKSANLAQVVSNWLIGKRVSEQEKQGQERAEYGKRMVQLAADELSREFGKGYSATNVKSFVRFYKVFPDLQIGQTASAQLLLSAEEIGQTLSAASATPLHDNVCWSHYERLMRVADTQARLWYLEETAREQWSVATLRRNISTQYYYRLLQTPERLRPEVADEMRRKTAGGQTGREFLKNPVVIEFLGFSQDAAFTETKLESAIVSHIQRMIMEMGKGFAFVARQQHIRTDMGDFYIDLVFYNYILKCFFLIDLKTGMITHQDVGQMDMYVRMYDSRKRLEGDNPTIGLLLGSDTSQDMARYSMLHGSEQLFQAKYLTFLPTKEQLIREIEEQKEIFRLQHENDEE